MKLLVTSDWHLDAVTAGVRRFADLEAAVNELVGYAIGQQVAAVLFLGDLCDPDSGSCVFRCVRLAMEAALVLARAGIESHWIAGNHDVIEDGTADTVLAPLRAVREVGAPVHVYERPGLNVVGGRVALLALPYTALAAPYDPVREVREAAMMTKLPTVLAGHLMLDGIVPGAETTDMARGRDVLLPVREARHAFELQNLPLLMLNGHYHQRQQFNGVHVPGALERLTFGEEQSRPGWLVVEV